ncbi:MAG: 2-hydroxy-3-oxopropionate reductase [Actinobacteria bacterium]|nr:2-hydroxy-3-oxopropionate reductase [Actinomycetota bacterium]
MRIGALSLSANLVFQFADSPFEERFDRARAAGFDAVEYMFPYDYPATDLRAALDRNSLRQDLFNLPAGDFAAGERGVAVDPSRREEFRAGVEAAIGYAEALGCRKVNCLVGKRLPDIAWEDQLACLVDNLKRAAGRLGEAGVTLLVEMLNPVENRGFFLDSVPLAVRLLDEVGATNLRFQFDVYHVQRTQGEIIPTIDALGSRIGHYQIADAPARNEPGTGEIDCARVLEHVASTGYEGCVGLEYKPSTGRSEDCFGWIDEYGLERGGAVAAAGAPHAATGLPLIGFIGLGIMGKPTASNLRAAGYPMVVHSRSPGPVDELVVLGAERASSPAEVASRADVLVTMLPDTPDVEQVLFGDHGAAAALRAGSLVIDMSTIDPIATRTFHERLAERGIEMLDAPVSGGQKGAIEATLSIMVGGSQEGFARAAPIFAAIGKTIVHMGGPGAGQVAKACNQLIVASNIEAVAEALVLAAKAGVDPQRVREALLGGFAGSRILELHGQRMLDGAFQPGFRIRLHAKDARIVRGVAGALGVPVPAFLVASGSLEELAGSGEGELDHSALVLPIERGAGIELRGDAG